MRATKQGARAGAAAVALVLVGLGHAQDVRVSDFHVTEEWVGSFVGSGSGIRPVWGSIYEYCQTGSTDAVLREFDLGGRPLTSDMQMNEACGNPLFNDSAVLASGKFILMGGDGYNVWARIFDPSGSPLTGELPVRQSSTSPTSGRSVAVASGSSFAAVWDAESTGELFGRIIDEDGSMGPELLLEQSTPASGQIPEIAAFASGELLILWREGYQPPLRNNIIGRLRDGALAPLGPSFQVSETESPLNGHRASAIGSRALVLWARTTGTQDDVVGRWVDLAGGPQGNELVINTHTDDSQGWPDVAADAQGGLVATWSSYGQDGGSVGIYGQRFDGLGNPLGGEFGVNMTTWNPQGSSRVALLPSGDFAVMFASQTGDNLDVDVLMRRFFFPLSLAVAPGPGPANAPSVSILRPDGRPGPPAVAPYPGAAGHGATVGAGDVDGGLDELLTGPGPSPVYGPQVRAFRSDGTAIAKVNFYAYATLRYGVKEGTAGLDGDPHREILTTPGPGDVFGPHVRGWNFDGVQLQPVTKVSFFAYNTLRYGCNASRAELEADGYDEILTTPGPGAIFGAQLRAFDYDDTAVRAIGKINAYVFGGTSFGATVAAADIDSDGVGGYLDGFDEIVAGKGPGPANDSELRVLDYGTSGLTLTQRYAVASPLPYASAYGINVAGGDVDAGDTQEIATAPGPDPAAAARILCWEWNPKLGWPGNPIGATLQVIGTDDFTALAGTSYGANVAIGTFE